MHTENQISKTSFLRFDKKISDSNNFETKTAFIL